MHWLPDDSDPIHNQQLWWGSRASRCKVTVWLKFSSLTDTSGVQYSKSLSILYCSTVNICSYFQKSSNKLINFDIVKKTLSIFSSTLSISIFLKVLIIDILIYWSIYGLSVCLNCLFDPIAADPRTVDADPGPPADLQIITQVEIWHQLFYCKVYHCNTFHLGNMKMPLQASDYISLGWKAPQNNRLLHKLPHFFNMYHFWNLSRN